MQQRENMQITQPISAPSSPLAISPGNFNNFNLPGNSMVHHGTLVHQQANGSSHQNGGTPINTLPSSVADTGDPNWQATKSTVRERNAAMFNNDLMADIKFVVGAEGKLNVYEKYFRFWFDSDVRDKMIRQWKTYLFKFVLDVDNFKNGFPVEWNWLKTALSFSDQIQTIPAHKYVLATGSSVFYAMFYGGLAENKSEIKVPDVEPSAFLILLRYLYCDEILLEADTVLATLYVAKKYIVPHLARACVNFLETSLTAKNACLLLSQSRLFEEPELMQRCWEVIDAQVSVVDSLADGVSLIELEHENDENVSEEEPQGVLVVRSEVVPVMGQMSEINSS